MTLFGKTVAIVHMHPSDSIQKNKVQNHIKFWIKVNEWKGAIISFNFLTTFLFF